MPVVLSHRQSGDKSECRVRVSAKTKSALDEYDRLHNMSADLIIWQLMEFYRLERIDWLIDRLQAKYASGFTLTERAQLSVLYTVLGEIDRIVGLNPVDF